MWANVVEPLKKCCNFMSFGKADEPEGLGAPAGTGMGQAPWGTGMKQNAAIFAQYTPSSPAQQITAGERATASSSQASQDSVASQTRTKGDFEPGPGFVDPYRSSTPSGERSTYRGLRLTDWVSVYPRKTQKAVTVPAPTSSADDTSTSTSGSQVSGDTPASSQISNEKVGAFVLRPDMIRLRQ